MVWLPWVQEWVHASCQSSFTHHACQDTTSSSHHPWWSSNQPNLNLWPSLTSPMFSSPTINKKHLKPRNNFRIHPSPFQWWCPRRFINQWIPSWAARTTNTIPSSSQLTSITPSLWWCLHLAVSTLNNPWCKASSILRKVLVMVTKTHKSSSNL